jgi:hypothetical protein
MACFKSSDFCFWQALFYDAVVVKYAELVGQKAKIKEKLAGK